MKHRLLAASLVLVGGAAVGCGSGGAPTDATEEEFCDGFSSLFTDMAELADADDAEIVRGIKDWAATMEEIGTPEGISDEEREGFERSLQLISDLDEDASPEDFEKLDEELSEEEQDAVDAFDTYTTDTCGSPLEDLEAPESPETPAE
jgi:hypothetical protein